MKCTFSPFSAPSLGDVTETRSKTQNFHTPSLQKVCKILLTRIRIFKDPVVSSMISYPFSMIHNIVLGGKTLKLALFVVISGAGKYFVTDSRYQSYRSKQLWKSHVNVPYLFPSLQIRIQQETGSEFGIRIQKGYIWSPRKELN